ncbi:hypothetical protein VE25_07800 [Devosia geojensis]|uniref:Uncharacterized protein n=1 Tax=Devosia geojensis TaxID=443610 RepID=A0A0F5FV36_9HYPH|nr:hypothetical protein [Devosia geojensis]KKB12440.1 hypothetical protein VE25_07800 [Devosia geojensis]
MDRPSARITGLFETVAPQVHLLLEQWLDNAPRKEPVSPATVTGINRLLAAVRKIVSREPSVPFIAGLAPGKSALPGEIFVALLKADIALATFARRHSTVINRERVWTRRHGDRCPYCGSMETIGD